MVYKMVLERISNSLRRKNVKEKQIGLLETENSLPEQAQTASSDISASSSAMNWIGNYLEKKNFNKSFEK